MFCTTGKTTRVFTAFFGPVPGIYAVFSMLQEDVFNAKGTKSTVNYSVLAFGMHTRWRGTQALGLLQRPWGPV